LSPLFVQKPLRLIDRYLSWLSFNHRVLQEAADPRQQRPQYAVSPDGQRFLINVPIESASVSPITVVLNWNPGAKK